MAKEACSQALVTFTNTGTAAKTLIERGQRGSIAILPRGHPQAWLLLPASNDLGYIEPMVPIL